MAITPVNVGTAANDGTGDTLRGAFQKVNANISDLQGQINNKANAASLGTAAAEDVDAFASAAQGSKADTALQPAAIGSSVQAHDADLDTIAGLAKTDGGFIVGNGSAWTVESGSAARTSLGLGSAATQAASAFATSTQGGKADSAVQPGAGLVHINHGSTADMPRPSGAVVFWRGSVEPENGVNGDLWYDTSEDA